MIYWQDFLLDDFLGPSLVVRNAQVGGTSIMEDAKDKVSIKTNGRFCSQYSATNQETRGTQLPARMVGLQSSALDSIQDGMDADLCFRSALRLKGEG